MKKIVKFLELNKSRLLILEQDYDDYEKQLML